MRKTWTYLYLVLMAVPCVAVGQSGSRSTDMTCPKEFYADGKRCVPIRDETKPALRMAGQCPSGYRSSGKYCVADRSSVKAVNREKGRCLQGNGAGTSDCEKREN
jgi:hypothetical protein